MKKLSNNFSNDTAHKAFNVSDVEVTIDVMKMMRYIVALEEENLILRRRVADFLFRMPDETSADANTKTQEEV